MPIENVSVSSCAISLDDAHYLNKKFNRDYSYGDPIWIKKEDGIVPTQFFGYGGDRFKFTPYQNVRFERRVLKVFCRQGNTILMFNGFDYGLPLKQNRSFFFQNFKGELEENSSFYMDEDFVYVQDNLFLNLNCEDMFIGNELTRDRNLLGGYLIGGERSCKGYWYQGKFIKKRESLDTVKLDNFTKFILFGR